MKSTRTSSFASSLNRFDEEVSLSRANNAEVGAEDLDLHAVQLQRELSVREYDPVRPPEKFEPARFERVANTFIQRAVAELLREQVEVCADLHLRSYCGDEADTDSPTIRRPSIEPPRFRPLCDTLRTRPTQTLHAGGALSSRRRYRQQCPC